MAKGKKKNDERFLKKKSRKMILLSKRAQKEKNGCFLKLCSIIISIFYF